MQEERKKHSINEHKQWDQYFGRSASAGMSNGPSRTASPSGVGGSRSQNTGQKLGHNSINTLDNATRASNLRSTRNQHEEDDILAAFNASAPVDTSTHFPAPEQSRSSSRAPSVPPNKSHIDQSQNGYADEDDPFGLGTAPAPRTASINQDSTQIPLAEDDDDVLGLLGKPVSELPPRKSSSPPPSTATEAHPVDRAVAELVEMGFSAEKSQEALAATESGIDVQAAVGWLLNQAHSESRSKSQTPHEGKARRSNADPLESENNASGPAWMRQKSRASASRQQSEHRSTGAEKDAARYATELGNNFFKAANSLWNSGQRKITKAVADFNAENDSSQPRWMKEASMQRETSIPRRRESGTARGEPASRSPTATTQMTDDALLLEVGRERTQPTKSKSSKATPRSRMTPDSSPVMEDSKSGTLRRPVQQPMSAAQSRPRPTRKMNEEEEIQAYVSPARRKKAAPKHQEPEPELLFDSELSKTTSAQFSSTSTPSPLSQRSAVTKPSVPLPSRPKAPLRTIPTLSTIALQSSTSHRLAGTAAFKLGNYSEAASAYSSALRDLPHKHPLTIVLLTNRALTHLKNGDPKHCIADAESAIEVIGPSRGTGESIDIDGEEGAKDMAPYWGKAMMRRAEALEQLERLVDAAKIWKECVEAGVGGSTSIQGRNRCEKAAGISKPSSQSASRKPTPTPKKAAPKPNVTRSALDDLSGRPSLPHAASSEAVTRLRAANEAAAKADDEKFALSDSVAERVDQWRNGKENNLRALLGSLDTVLWADSGWKKVNMSELLNPNKVKINYMKGIAKVHPDKVRMVIERRMFDARHNTNIFKHSYPQLRLRSK